MISRVTIIITALRSKAIRVVLIGGTTLRRAPMVGSVRR